MDDLNLLIKAELLQLNRTQFPSLGILLVKELEIEKTKTTCILVGLSFSEIQLFY